MAIKRLLTGSSFAPEAITVIGEAYETARAGLALAPDGKEANELAKLMFKIAAAKTELSAQSLAAEARMAWAERGANSS
jgi:hypothetical protein